MATLSDSMVVIADRYAQQVVLAQSRANQVLDEDNLWQLSLPAGFGNCLIQEVQLQETGLPSLIAAYSVEDLGVSSFVVSEAGVPRDFVDVGGYVLTSYSPIALSVHLRPDRLVMWNQDELLLLYLPRVTDDATDVGDLYVAVAVRQLLAEGR